MAEAFNFGENWKNFSSNAVSEESLAQSRRAFKSLVGTSSLDGKSFIDIGFGQGLGILNAASLKANVVGCDINPLCRDALLVNQRHFPDIDINKIPIVIGSILETSVVAEIKKQNDSFDIVHSWGVLHHTGDMETAVKNAASLTAKKGLFIVSIYRKHWSSKPWLFIKWLYNSLPKVLKTVVIWLMYPIIWLAKLLVTGKNPRKKDRGMNFFYDVIDWVGGYPYEYATPEEMKELIEPLGFRLVRENPPKTPIGCHEYVFEKV